MTTRNEQNDLHLLADAFFLNLEYSDWCEYGSVGVDCKRPFGDSDVEADILEIVGWNPLGQKDGEGFYSDEQRDYARDLYCEKLVPYLRNSWFSPDSGQKRDEMNSKVKIWGPEDYYRRGVEEGTKPIERYILGSMLYSATEIVNKELENRRSSLLEASKEKVIEKFYHIPELKEDPDIKIATKVSIDFPEWRWIPGNPYPATYDNVVAHFLGVVVRKENGEYESKLDYGLDVGRTPENLESQKIGEAMEKIVPFLNRTAEEFRNQTAHLNSVLPRSS